MPICPVLLPNERSGSKSISSSMKIIDPSWHECRGARSEVFFMSCMIHSTSRAAFVMFGGGHMEVDVVGGSEVK